MKKVTFIISLLFFCGSGFKTQAQIKPMTSKDSLGSHLIQKDAKGKILGWYKPQVPGATYSHVAKLAAEFIKDGVPVDPSTGLKLYYISCCFHGPHMVSEEKFREGRSWENWMHNPANVFAGMVQSLALDYYSFTGDRGYIDVVREMLDYQLENGTTPEGWEWPNVPYASSDPGSKIYEGATLWETDAMRGDGLHGIEPDKVGELGHAYLKFYQITGEEKYLKAAIDCAKPLAKYVRGFEEGDSFFGSNMLQSPWPFRVNARTGKVIDNYTAHIIEPIKLFEELLRTKDKISLDQELASQIEKANNTAWEWLYSKFGPIKTFVWTGFFEDVGIDEALTNRNQVSPMETARYLIKNPHKDPDLNYTVPALLNYVATAFATEGMDAIKEQTWCYEPMASHSARYASVNALWYEKTGDERFKDEAYRFFNFASYMTDDNGVVRVGPTWPGSWFSDGYADYIKHYMEGLAAVPEWAPVGEDHLLRSKSAVQNIDYKPGAINCRTFDEEGQQVYRLSFKPNFIAVNGKKLSQSSKNNVKNSYTWRKLEAGGVLKINYSGGNEIVISKEKIALKN